MSIEVPLMVHFLTSWSHGVAACSRFRSKALRNEAPAESSELVQLLWCGFCLDVRQIDRQHECTTGKPFSWMYAACSQLLSGMPRDINP